MNDRDHDRAEAYADQRVCWCEDREVDLLQDWRIELGVAGRVEHLGLDQAEIDVEAKHANQTTDAYLASEASKAADFEYSEREAGREYSASVFSQPFESY